MTLDDPVESLPESVARFARERPDAPLIKEYEGAIHSYSQVWSRARLWGSGFRSVGIRPGDRVITMSPPRAEWFAVWLGLSLIGAVEVAVNTGFRGPILDYALRSASARVLVCSRGVLDSLDLDAARGAGVEIVAVHDGPGIEHDTLQIVDAREFLADVEPVPERSVPLDELACMTLTSGTTGPSKFVMSPWGVLWLGGTGALPVDDITRDDCFASPLPIYHAAARFTIVAMVLKGGSVAFGDTFTPERYWADVAAHGCTLGNLAWFAKPLWDLPARDHDATTPMRGALAGPMPPFYREFGERFALRFCSAFGMSEVGAPISTGWDPPNFRTCGRIRNDIPGYEARLLGPDGEPVPPGEMGELCVRSERPELVTFGYFGMPEQTAAAWRDGWFRTGDGFRSDEDGWVYFVDRTKDAIRRRGRNISSFEVEAIVNGHHEVAESAAVAVPADDGQEEEVLVFVVRTPGSDLSEDALVSHLTEQMPRYMVPLYLEFVDSLPKTDTTLRVRKCELRDRGVSPATWRRPSSRPQSIGGDR